MKKTKDIIIFINNKTVEIFNKMIINYKSPEWEKKTLEAIQLPEDYISIYETGMTSRDVLSLRNTLTARGIPHKVIIEESIWRHCEEEKTIKTKKTENVKRTK